MTTPATNPRNDFRLARSLVTLMQPEKSDYIRNFNDCREYLLPKEHHPFGLSVPLEDGIFATEIFFIKTEGPDMTVEAFHSAIRFHTCYTRGKRITKLRIIKVPLKLHPGKHDVFFEVWIGNMVFISGRTNDFSGAGCAAREELESTLSLLSYVFKVETDTFIMPLPIGHLLEALYEL